MSTELTRQETQLPEQARREAATIRPRYEVHTSDDSYRIDVEMPGVPKNEANITIEGDQLTIEGHRRDHAAESWEAIRREIPLANYRLVLDLNAQIDAEKVSAKSENGILQVSLPVAEAARPRRIEVS